MSPSDSPLDYINPARRQRQPQLLPCSCLTRSAAALPSLWVSGYSHPEGLGWCVSHVCCADISVSIDILDEIETNQKLQFVLASWFHQLTKDHIFLLFIPQCSVSATSGSIPLTRSQPSLMTRTVPHVYTTLWRIPMPPNWVATPNQASVSLTLTPTSSMLLATKSRQAKKSRHLHKFQFLPSLKPLFAIATSIKGCVSCSRHDCSLPQWNYPDLNKKTHLLMIERQKITRLRTLPATTTESSVVEATRLYPFENPLTRQSW